VPDAEPELLDHVLVDPAVEVLLDGAGQAVADQPGALS
jgi:hypothetical protein